LPFPLCAKAAGAKIFSAAAQQSTAKTRRNSKENSIVPVGCVFLLGLTPSLTLCLQPDWDANTAVFSLVNLLRTRAARINLNFNPQNLP
jgi:hypothetical protein